MKIYITKYALTKGIIEVEAEPFGIFESVEINYQETKRCKLPDNRYHKNDYTLSLKDAIDKAYEMREKKIKSLQKQVKKLQRMSFYENE